MDNRPIGVFDSGLGGLTAVKKLVELLPGEDIVYFGDTGRVPYGSRSRETIIKYTRQDIRFLLQQDGGYGGIDASGQSENDLFFHVRLSI